MNHPPSIDDSPKPAADPEKTHAAGEFKHDRPLVSCRFDPAGRFVFAGSEDSSVVRWDLASGSPAVLKAHESWVYALGLSPDGEALYTGGCDGRLIWWPAAADAPAPVRTIEAHQGWIRSIAVSPDGATIATAGNDKRVRLWSAADGALLRELAGHERLVYAATFHPDGKQLATADLKGQVIHWELPSGRELRRLDAGKLWKYETGQGVDYGGVRDLSFGPGAKQLACSGQVEASNPLGAVSNPAVLVIDWETGQEVVLQRPKEDLKGVAWGVRFHPTGFFVVASGGTSGGFLWFGRPGEANEFAKFSLPNTARAMDLHPDGLRVATAHHDGALRISSMTAKVG